MMLCNMMHMKKMIASHRAACDMIGVALGITLGFLAANAMVNKCTCGNSLKKKAKKAFKCLEDKIS